MSSQANFRRGEVAIGEVAPIPARGGRPPKVWATLAIEETDLVVRLKGWRSLLAVTRQLRVPLDTVVSVAHDPAARSHVQAKLRRRASRTGVMRLGSYHSLEGWSFWAIGLGRNALVLECSGARYRYIVVEVAEPVVTARWVRDAAAVGAAPARRRASDGSK